MATQLATFPPTTVRGRKPSLPWGKWFDGSVYRLECGVDIKAKSLKVMIDVVRKTAKRKKVVVHVHQEKTTNTIVVQAEKPEKKSANKRQV